MDATPRNIFDCRLSNRYWQVPIDIPMATYYNVPIGTHFCDTLPYLCHPQRYGKYRNIDRESDLYSLDYYNLYDTICTKEKTYKRLQPELIKQQYNGIPPCDLINPPRLFNNTTKLFKYNQY